MKFVVLLLLSCISMVYADSGTPFSWTAGTGSGSGSARAGGSSGQIQWNNGGSFAGISGSVADVSGNVTLGGMVKFTSNTTIGTGTSSAALLDVFGDISATTTSPSLLILTRQSSGNAVIQVKNTSGNTSFFGNVGGNNAFGIASSENLSNGLFRVSTATGNTMIGTNANALSQLSVNGNSALGGNFVASSTLHVSGTARISTMAAGAGTGAVCWDSSSGLLTTGTCTVSDVRLKENVFAFQNGLAFVNDLKPVTFTFKDTQRYDNRVHAGLIAQQVEAVEGGSIFVTDGGIVGEERDASGTIVKEGISLKAVDYASLVVPLIAAVQELSERVEELENR